MLAARVTRKSDIRMSYEYEKVVKVTTMVIDDQGADKLCYVLDLGNGTASFEYSDWDCLVSVVTD